ncbi:MAG: amidohydrolase [Clostridiales bacterium]|nr:amidohydrolase [Clostridiales bacterium]
MIIKDIKILDESFQVRDHMNVVVEDGKFLSITKGMPEPEGREVIDGNGKFMMPAFYNTHCHVPMTLLRGYGEGLPLQRWLQERIFPFEAKFSPEYKYWGAKLGALELVKSGCVSISDMYFDLVDYGRALYEAGMKANLCNGLVTFDDDASYYKDRSYEDTLNLLQWIKDNEAENNGRIKADASVHSEYANKEKALEEAFAFAADEGLILQAHLSETKSEHEECKARHGLSPAAYFEKLGAFRSPFIAAHCVWLDDEDIDILTSHGVYMSHNASSNLKLGSGIAPVKKYFERGMNITIGTDGASSNNNLNMLEEVNLAALLCRGESLDANAISAAELVKAATRGGALAQGRDDCGLIKEGFRADFILFDIEKEHLTPDYDTLANILFSAQSSDICMTVCDGEIICKDGEALFIDEEETIAKAEESFEKVLESL